MGKVEQKNDEPNESKAQKSQEIADRLVSFRSHDEAISFLHQHRNQINHTIIELLKDKVAYHVRVDVDRALAIADITLEAAAIVGDPLSDALSFRARAIALDCSGQCLKALEFYDQAEAIYKQLSKEIQAARIARAKIGALMMLGRYEDALAAADGARQIFQTHGELRLVAQVDANVGSLYQRLDQYHKALPYYTRAAKVFERLNDRESLAMVQQNLAVVYFYLNEFERSLALYRRARQIYHQIGLHLLAVQVDYNVACLYLRRGRFDHALNQFNWVESEALKFGDATQAALCKLDLTEVYLQLNALEDALQASRVATQQFKDLQMIYELAKAKIFQAMAYLHLGALDHAAPLLHQARTLFTQEGNQIYQALCDLYLSEVALKQQNWDQAMSLCQAAGRIFESNQLDRKSAYATFQLAKIQLQFGNVQAALSLCEQASKKYESLEAPWLKYQCDHLRGNLAEHLGEETQAYQSYKQAINHIEQMRSSIQVDEFKTTFVKDKLKIYEDMVKLCLKEGSGEKQQEAFRFVEAAKSRALVELLSNTLEVRKKRGARVDQETIERWSTLRQELDWYYNKFNESESLAPPRRLETGRKLRENIRQREEELAKLLRQLQLKDPEYFSLHGVPVVTCADIADQLAPHDTLLEYYLTGDEINVFVIDSSGLRVARPLCPAPPVRRLLRKLRFQLHKLFLDAAYVQKYEATLRRFTDEHLNALYQLLIEPIIETLEGKHLVIVPHDFLHYVPFQALLDGRQYLIDRFEVSYCPSAHVFLLCQQRRQGRNGRAPALIVGVQDAKLPFIDEEVAALRSLLPGAEVLVGEDANLEQFRRRAEQCGILHLASHAIFRQDNPLFSALRLANSWLNFYDLFQLDLQADLVTLSACQTGVNKIFAGDELVGLMRGFLYAGAPSLLISLWAVNDRSTAELMKAFYSHLNRGRRARAALREAQLAIREQYPHPFHWAPFVLMGRP